MKKLVIILLSLFLFNVQADTIYEQVKFEKCVDGDTAYFTNSKGEKVKYRFLAIDTPETVHPTKAVEAYGKDASEYTCNRLTNAKLIEVEAESSNKTDKYGRHLGWIWVDGTLLQQELIDAGYAEVAYIYGIYKYTESLCLVQQDAKKNQLGIWYDGTREEGYCSTVDLATVQNIISYDNLDKDNKTTQKTNTSDDENKMENSFLKELKKANDITENINNFIGTDKFSNIILYVILGAAALSIFIKKKKD